MEKPKAGGDAVKKRNRTYIGAAAIGIVAIGLVTWLLTGEDSSKSEAESGAARIVSADALPEEVSGLATPVYWAGERQETELELSRPDERRTYVRYLTDGAKAGDPSADFLTVGTYAYPGAVAALRRQGKESGGVLGTAPGGATVYFDGSNPQSVYLAFPGVDAQIEVYDPDFKQALQLVNSGQIVPSD